MKIALIAPEIFPVPPVRGGAVETLLHEMSLRLDKHHVLVLGPADPELPDENTAGHIRYKRYRKGVADKLLLCTYKLPFKQSDSPLYQLPYVNWLCKQLREWQPDGSSCHPGLDPGSRRAGPGFRISLRSSGMTGKLPRPQLDNY